MNSKTGTLYIVATPIGNLADFGTRAAETLSKVDLILAEDTRHAGKLLKHYGIETRTRAFHDHNEQTYSAEIINLLTKGDDIALISDAGTPLISDPGYRLVRMAREQSIDVSPIPGPSALTAAVSASGMATDRFCFEGFLPSKRNQRIEKLTELVQEQRTMIFYESSHRIKDSLEDLEAIYREDREICVAREITKKFESFYFGSPAMVREQIVADSNNLKGEFVIVVSGNNDADEAWANACNLVNLLVEELPAKKACRISADTFAVSKNQLYDFVLARQKPES
jgi:16S rRNA (cytidine1402-2'-O)-methyltransferase